MPCGESPLTVRARLVYHRQTFGYRSVSLPSFNKESFIPQCGLTMRAQCKGNRYFPDPLGIVTLSCLEYIIVGGGALDAP